MGLRVSGSGRSLVLLTVLLAARVAAAAEPPLALGSYEIKFSLDTAKSIVAGSVDGGPELSERLTRLFAVKDKQGTRMAIQFLDDCQYSLTKGGWAVRIRDKAGKWELTYKRRYPATPDVAAALKQADKDGFKSQADQKVEVDIAGERQTLSLSIGKDLAPSPAAEAFVTLATAKPPQTLPPDMLAVLKAAQVYGPIPARRWKGMLPSGEEVAIEAWRLGGSHIVELSSKATDSASADKRRGQLRELVETEDLGAAGEVLKTEAVFAAFQPGACK
jgi:hypothetical protein